MNLQTLFHNRQTLLQEQEQVLQQLQAEDATSEDLKDLQRRLQALIQERSIVNQQIQRLEAFQGLPDPSRLPTEEQARVLAEKNRDHEAKAKFDMLQTVPSYPQHMQQLQQERELQNWVQSLSPRERVLQQAGLLNRDGSTTRPLTEQDELIIRHALSDNLQ